jgi:hypothetical protein
MVCGTCHEDKPDVTMRENPYKSEIGGDDTPEPLCNDCEHEAAMDI